MPGGRSRKVVCKETGIIYKSLKNAAKDIGQDNYTSISLCCNGKRKSAYGYHWEYYEDPDLPGEIWKDAKCITDGILYDFSGSYMCSNKGRIKSTYDGVITYGSKAPDGYIYIKLKGVRHSVHRVIATTFLPNPNNKPTVDHIDTNRSNNCIENLRWATMKDQANNEITKERVKKSIRKTQELNKKNNYNNVKNASISRKKAVLCITTGEKFDSVASAAREYKISASSIAACCRGEEKTYKGKKWKYI